MRGEAAWGDAVQAFFIAVGKAVARWTRLEYEGPERLPDPPALLVANHGFGGVVDLNAFVIAALAERLVRRDDVQFTILAHKMAWTFGLGPLLEPAGVRVASWESALRGLSEGHYVLVMPGGDLDAMKSFFHRNEVVFGGRKGFAKVAIEAKVPIVPIVVSGAGETLFVLSDGQRLAKLLRLPELLRSKTLPISISIPYGLSIGVAGLLPYFPLPAKMRAAVLDPIYAKEGETYESLADRVHCAMSSKLTEMTAGRVPFFGMKWDELLGRHKRQKRGARWR
jgi:1-acyl-sn-glycerol-3-phosphate acyltransferase